MGPGCEGREHHDVNAASAQDNGKDNGKLSGGMPLKLQTTDV
jgi:hypothetical protein